MGGRTKKYTVAVLALLSLAFGFFSNCSQVKTGSQGQSVNGLSATGGGGYDGKPYNFQRFDEVRCADKSANGQPAPNAVIAVSQFDQSPKVQLVRENCAPITPVVLDSTDYRVVADGSLEYKSRAYHAEMPNSFAPIGFPLITPQGQSYWGGAECIADTFLASEIGNGGKVASQRFRAQYAGGVRSIKTYFSTRSARGTGGSIRVRVYADDGTSNHLPNLAGGVFAEGNFVPGLINGAWSTNRAFTEIAMNSSQPLQSGQLYHVYYENTDANSLQNFISLESQVTGPAHGRPCRFLSPFDWGFTRSQYSVALTDMTLTAQDVGYLTPVLQVRMSGGEVIGNANVAAGNTSAQIYEVRSGRPIRTRITPVVSHGLFAIHVQTAASVAGSLNWSLKEGATVLASGSISEAAANYREGVLLDVPGGGFFEWYALTLPAGLNLNPGRTYDLEFSVSDASVWKFAAHVDGSESGFSAPAVSAEVRAERFNGTSWIGFDLTNLNNNGRGHQWRVTFEDRLLPSIPAVQTAYVYTQENASRVYSFSEVALKTFRHEVRAGDFICPGGNCEPSERSEISIPGSVTDANSVMTVTYDLRLEPGPVSTAGWAVLGSFSVRNLTPEFTGPIEINLLPGDRMAVNIGWLRANPSSLTPDLNTNYGAQPVSFAYAYQDPAALQRGRNYAIKIETRLHPQAGFVRVYRDGVQIVNYVGPVGFDVPTVWRSGIWRQPAPESLSVVFTGLQVTR